MIKTDIQICKFNLALFLQSLMLLSPILLLFYNENGLEVRDLFFCQGIVYLCAILFDIPIGYFSNTWSRKHLLTTAFVIFLFVSLLWLFFKGYYIILAGEILYAITKTTIDNVPPSYLYDYLATKNKNMTKYWGYTNFYLAFGVAVGSLSGAFLYAKFGSKFILSLECLIMLVCILLVSSLPNIKPSSQEQNPIIDKIKQYISDTKQIYHNKAIKYHIFYSGLINAYSFLFALGFQPLMKNALFPIAVFGIVTFMNNFVRSMAGVIAGKWFRNTNIRSLIIPTYISFILAFIAIFLILHTNVFIIKFILMFFICLVIGGQVIFRILHFSRIHRFVSEQNRGSLMTVNNIIARLFPAVILIFSRLFLNDSNLNIFFIAALLIFVIFGGFIMMKIYRVKD